jgi:hypothetical protein
MQTTVVADVSDMRVVLVIKRRFLPLRDAARHGGQRDQFTPTTM